MGLRFRKSINLGGGVRLNFNKKSTGISFGTKGARYSINSNGRKTASIGIPGTGLYWTESKTKNSKNGNKQGGSLGCLIWILFFPFIIIYYMFKYMIKFIIFVVKKIVEILKGEDEKKKKIVYIGLAVFGIMLIISVASSAITGNIDTKDNNKEIIKNETSNEKDNTGDLDDDNPTQEVTQDTDNNDNYIYTSEYSDFIQQGLDLIFVDDDIIRTDKVDSYQISSDSVAISLYTNKFYNYSTIENKSREITKKLLDFYSTKEYKKEYLLSPSSISIIIDIRGNSKDIYTKEIQNTFMVLSQIKFTTEDFKNVSSNVDDYITMSNKMYFGE